MSHGRTAALVVILLIVPTLAHAQSQPGPVIESGATVHFEYMMKDGAGAVISSNRGWQPLRYVHGRSQIPPGLERALAGLHAGDQKSVSVAPEDAFGPVDPQATAEIPKESLPAEALVVGTPLVAKEPDGGERAVRVKEVRERTVVLDLNHPLAGQTLHFDLRVLDVTPPP
jgi:FKBP-type peptidyl-prolyl cis-trans isomerase 2